MSSWRAVKSQPALIDVLYKREQIFAGIRHFFTQRGYHEVDLPLLSPALIPESYLEIFETQLLDRHRKPQPAFLIPSPEIFLKKLIVAGYGNCFSLNKVFRNTENLSDTHNPEFTMLEWYQLGADYKDVMSETEKLVVYLTKQQYSSIRQLAERSSSQKNQPCSQSPDSNNKRIMIQYQGQQIDLTPPWERLTMVEAFAKHAQVNLLDYMELPQMQKLAEKRGYKVDAINTWEQLFHQIYLNEVEPKFGQGKPTIIYDFPAQMAALARKKSDDPRFAERFEVFIAGLELGDAYSELTDWKEQEARFKAELEERNRLGKINHPADWDFIEALKAGLPKCSGMAMGIDRLVMLLTDAKTIQEVIPFSAAEMWSP